VKKALGAFLVSLPFLTIAALVQVLGGVPALLFVFGIGAATLSMISAGMYLLSDSER
jgi:hypothetical protein